MQFFTIVAPWRTIVGHEQAMMPEPKCAVVTAVGPAAIWFGPHNWTDDAVCCSAVARGAAVRTRLEDV